MLINIIIDKNPHFNKILCFIVAILKNLCKFRVFSSVPFISFSSVCSSSAVPSTIGVR